MRLHFLIIKHNTKSNMNSNDNPQRISSLKTFLAYDESIRIVPNFSYKDKISKFMLTQRKIGPFIAGEESIVPLWLGIYLRKRNLCRLVAPHWLNVDHLKRVLEHERDQNKQQFSQELPFRYMEISRSILQSIGAGRSGAHASGGAGAGGHEEIPQVEVIRLLLEDISTVRMDKIRRNVHTMSAETMVSSMVRPMPIVDVTGIGSVEMAAIKPFLERSFADHFKIVGTGTSTFDDKNDEHANSRLRPRTRRVGSRNTATSEQQQHAQNVNIDPDDEDDSEELLEPTAEEESSEGAIARVRARRYRS